MDGTSGLVIDVEKKVEGQGLNELIAEGASEKEIKLAMTHLVIKRFIIFKTMHDAKIALSL